jgi:glycosyltransferase involved in cell wall biosynthesis
VDGLTSIFDYMSLNPQTAVFFSSIREWGWGAPDYIWPIAAHKLLDQGFRVVAVVHPSLIQREEILSLQARGADILPQPSLTLAKGRINQLRKWFKRFNLQRHRFLSLLENLPTPHLFVNQGGSYDILQEEELCRWIKKQDVSYDLLFHSNNYSSPLTEAVRCEAISVFTKAKRCLFNSRWTHQLTESQILTTLGNASYFNCSVRFPFETPLPWPEEVLGTPLKFAAVCRMDAHHKGLDALLQGLALLPQEAPPWTLDLYGHGPDIVYLEGLTTWLKLESRVSFHPYTTEVANIWKSHHMLLLTSRYEGLAVSMLEAMACGRPVLRTPYGGCSEWIVPEETGFICPAAEPELIAETIQLVFQSQNKLKGMGQRAFDRVRSRLPHDPWSVYLEPFLQTK